MASDLEKQLELKDAEIKLLKIHIKMLEYKVKGKSVSIDNRGTIVNLDSDPKENDPIKFEHIY